jgi:WD40 repeat protein
MTPTARPIENLCRNMTGDPASKTNLEMLSDKMRETPQALHHYVQQITGAETEVPFLIVVDQFEEIFTLCRDPEDRQAFLDNLLTAALLPGSAAAVIALRADFYHRCAEYEKLREALEAHQVYIGAMTPEELCQAIVAPAQHNAWSFEPGLVDLMLKDVGAGDHRGAEPGALPLLSHALLETWKRRQGRTLTLKGYTDAGGVRGAIARSAETVYDGLDPAQQHIARSIFLRLTEIGDADEEAGLAIYTRRRATRQEIEPASTGNDGVRTVLDTLARERLITMGHDTVEVAHEALIREWPTLRTWLEEDLEGLRIHRHLTEAAQAWANRGDDPGELYRGARLAQAKAWAETTDRQLSSLERDFLNAAAAEAARAEAAREAQRQRELKAAQDLAHAQQRRAEERGRLLRWLGLIAGLLLIAAIAAASLGQSYRRASQESAALADAKATVAAENAAVAATAQAAEAQADAALKREAQQHAAAEEAEREAADQRDAAQAQARINLANSLAGQATIHEEKNSELALLLALEANAMRDAPQTRGALMSALEHSPGHIEYLTDNAGSVQALAVSPDGAVLASAGGNNVHLWETETGRPIGEPLTDVGDDVRDLVFIDDRTLVILARTYDEHPSVLLAPASQATGIGKPSMILTSTRFSGGIESYMAINPDGRSLAIAGCGATFAVPPGGVFCDRGGGATVWDITGSQNGDGVSHEVVSLEITGEIYDVAYSPDGDRIALVGCTSYRDNTCEQGFSMLWQPETGETFMLDQGTVNNAPMALINAVAFTPDGAHLAVGGCSAYDATGVCQEGRAELWDLIETAQIAAFTIEGENGCQSLAVSPGGQTLALGSSDTIRLWKPLMQELDGLPMIGHTGHVMALAFKPDDRALFSGGQDRKIGVWDLALRGGIGSRLTSQLIPALHVAYAPDGALIAAGTPGGVNLWDAATGDLAYRLALSDPSAIVWDVDFSPDGQTLAAAGLTDSKIRLWDLATRARLGQPVKFAPGGGAYSVAFSPDGKTLAASGEGAEITLWDVNSLINSAPVSRTLTGHEHGGNPQVTFSPDGALLASAGHDNTVRLWDVATGEQRGETMTAHEDNVLTVAFSPDGRILASGGQDTTIRLWDVATQARIAELYGHDQFVWRLALTPDGDTLVSFDAWGILRLWDMRDPTKPGQPIGETQPGHKAWAWGLALSPDGAQAITSARSGELQRWQIDLAWWRERACDIASRNLTLEEWENYLPGEPYRKTCR